MSLHETLLYSATHASNSHRSDECQEVECLSLLPLPIPMEGEQKTVIFGTNMCGRVEIDVPDCA